MANFFGGKFDIGGGQVDWYDPHVSSMPQEITATRLERWDHTSLAEYQAAVIVTAHPEVEHTLLLENKNLAVIDSRNALKGHQAPNLVRL